MVTYGNVMALGPSRARVLPSLAVGFVVRPQASDGRRGLCMMTP